MRLAVFSRHWRSCVEIPDNFCFHSRHWNVVKEVSLDSHILLEMDQFLIRGEDSNNKRRPKASVSPDGPGWELAKGTVYSTSGCPRALCYGCMLWCSLQLLLCLQARFASFFLCISQWITLLTDEPSLNPAFWQLFSCPQHLYQLISANPRVFVSLIRHFKVFHNVFRLLCNFSH